MQFTDADGGSRNIPLVHGIIAGWTARDRAAVDHHIEELAAIGVPAPSAVPLYYRVAAATFTQQARIEVVGSETSGEVEPVVIDDGETLWLGVGSDHTDRALETYSVALSKQICPKPLSRTLWRFNDIADRLDALELRSWVKEDENADWVPYQEGTLSTIRPLAELITGAPTAAGDSGRLAAGTAMLCGTLTILSGGVRPASAFRMELRDPLCGRSLEHHYEIAPLPVVS